MKINEDNLKKFMKLPLSERLEKSLEDLERCENSSVYKINMDHWIVQQGSELPCYVCHAGALMCNRFVEDIKHGDQLSAFDIFDCWSTQTSNFLLAIDNFRQGCFPSACCFLGINYKEFCEQDGIEDLKNCFTEYRVDPKKYKQNFKIIINAIKEMGL